jgi:hypothetical protein
MVNRQFLTKISNFYINRTAVFELFKYNTIACSILVSVYMILWKEFLIGGIHMLGLKDGICSIARRK